MNKQINLLLRTSNRPIGFKRMLDSIKSNDTTGVDIRIIVSVDNEETKQYAMNIGGNDIEIIEFDTPIRTDIHHNPYDLYLNDMIDMVTDGWIMIIDDDDYVSDTVLSDILKYCNDPSVMYIFKALYVMNEPPLILPIPNEYGYCGICHIAMPNMVFNKDNNFLPVFDGVRGSDHKYYHDYVMSRGKFGYVDAITYYLDSPGGNGNTQDIVITDSGEIQCSRPMVLR